MEYLSKQQTKLNMDRCMDLKDCCLMTPAGRRVFENADEKKAL